MNYSREDILKMLQSKGDSMQQLFDRAHETRLKYAGKGVYLRGLIEYSNRCRKNCYYCGIRREHCGVLRYTLSHEQVMSAVDFAVQNDYASIVIQGGENSSENHIHNIERILRDIKKLSPDMAITLSFGEQTRETFCRWMRAGAHRYLLRIESSNRELYSKIHPCDNLHSYDLRVQALKDLKQEGYQTGSGVMIGLPYQTIEHLTDDILFLKSIDIDMCGMGPYIECEGTPLAELSCELMPLESRLEMTLKMIAVLRLVMPDINIAATTALEAIGEGARKRALSCGANVIMPNITPCHKSKYKLYDNKPETFYDPKNINEIEWGSRGDSARYKKR